MATIKIAVSNPYAFYPRDTIDFEGVSYRVVAVDIGTQEIIVKQRFWANRPWLVAFILALVAVAVSLSSVRF